MIPLPLPLALSLLLGADPVVEPPPSPPAPGGVTEEPETAPGEPKALPAAPRPPFSREWGIQAGWSAVTLAGVGASGQDVRLAVSFPRGGLFPGTAVLSVETFFGETSTGLLVRSLTLDAEVWVPVGRFLRLGGGVGLGVAGYQRATSGEWPVTLPFGLRVGAEVAPLRWRTGALVVGGHLAGHLEEVFWGSASVLVGLRLGGGP